MIEPTAPTSIEATYRFTRDSSTPVGALSLQRPSTDAMNAVSQWAGLGPDRAYDELEVEDDYLVVRLSFLVADRNKAGVDLHGFCQRNGVKSEYLA